MQLEQVRAYGLVIGSVHFRRTSFVHFVMGDAINSKDHCLLECPRSDILGELSIAGGFSSANKSTLNCINIKDLSLTWTALSSQTHY